MIINHIQFNSIFSPFFFLLRKGHWLAKRLFVLPRGQQGWWSDSGIIIQPIIHQKIINKIVSSGFSLGVRVGLYAGSPCSGNCQVEGVSGPFASGRDSVARQIDGLLQPRESQLRGEGRDDMLRQAEDPRARRQERLEGRNFETSWFILFFIIINKLFIYLLLLLYRQWRQTLLRATCRSSYRRLSARRPVVRLTISRRLAQFARKHQE